MDVVIYHNPDCGTSRNTLALIRNAGIEPHVIEYLKTPPARALLEQLVARMGIGVRDLLREKGTPFARAGPGRREPVGRPTARRHDGAPDPHQPADRRLAARASGCAVHPRRSWTSCRPQRGAFAKEDGERVTDASGQRVSQG